MALVFGNLKNSCSYDSRGSNNVRIPSISCYLFLWGFASFSLSEHNFPPHTWRRWVLESRLTLFHFDNERGGKGARERMREYEWMNDRDREGEGRWGGEVERREEREAERERVLLTPSVWNMLDLVYMKFTFSHQSLGPGEWNTRSRVYPGSGGGVF